MGADFTLFGHLGGPNPPKVAFLLSELGLSYEVKLKEFGEGPNGVKAADFLKINPNGRVPALIDHKNGDFVVWESAACLYYLAEKYGPQFIGNTVEEKSTVMQWVAFQISGHGPVQGMVNWMKHYHEKVSGEKPQQSMLDRYHTWEQLKQQEAKGSKFIAGNSYTIADISFHGWLRTTDFGGLTEDLNKYPRVKAWTERNEARPATKAGHEAIYGKH